MTGEREKGFISIKRERWEVKRVVEKCLHPPLQKKRNMALLRRVQRNVMIRRWLKKVSRIGFCLIGIPMLSLVPLKGEEDSGKETGGEAKTSVFFPLEEIRPGMKGEWHTVVRGTEVETFPLEILAVVPNFIAPQRAAIIARALDERNILSGPVSGMSGSPVTIDGRLVGAYAYGFSWPREQAIIGITPIKDMLEVWDVEERAAQRGRVAGTARGGMDPRLFFRPEHREDPWSHWVEEWADLPMPTPGSRMFRGPAEAGPMLLQSGGFHARVREQFAPLWDGFGFALSEGAVGGGGEIFEGEDGKLEAGSAVAAVLLDGDFNLAATGTVTHRDGNRLLAFGHPFLGVGQTAIPMAPARVVTVVQRVNLSFKLSQAGPVMGSIGQDRLSAISGEIGSLVPTTRYRIRQKDGEEERVLAGNLFRDQSLSPMIAGMMLMQSLMTRMDFEEEQTFRLTTRLTLEGVAEPILYEEVAAGGNALFQLALGHLFRHARVVNNPFAPVAVEELDFEVETLPREEAWRLVEVRTDRLRYRPGETIFLRLRVENFRGEPEERQVRVSIPADLRSGQTVTLLVGDAAYTQRNKPDLQTQPRNLDQFIERERSQTVNDSLYIMLLREQAGVEMDGVIAPDLPASVYASLLRSREGSLLRPVGQRLLESERISWTGEVRGSFRRQLTLD